MVLLLIAAMASGAVVPPVVKVSHCVGRVEYSRDGREWVRITRDFRYLAPGYRLRTGDDGSAEVTLLTDGGIRRLGPESIVEIMYGRLQLWVGTLSPPEQAAGSAIQALWNRLERSQRYLMVRRYAPTLQDFRPARRLRISTMYPDIVWENVYPEVGYRLTIGDRRFDIAPQPDAEFIRFTVPDLAPGEYRYNVAVVQFDEVQFEPAVPRTLIRASPREAAELEAVSAPLREGPAADPALLAAVQADHGFLVAALDTLRAYFDNPDAQDGLRPLLAYVYAELGLTGLQQREARASQARADRGPPHRGVADPVRIAGTGG